MGASVSGFWNKIFGNKQARIIMVGLDAAGKTTVLYKLKLNETITTIPTIGFNVEKLEHKNVDLTVWDIGGQDKIRPLWRHYYNNTDGVIFVVDSADKERLEIAREELEKTLAEDELRDACVLVYANKQDLPGALSTKEIASGLGLDKMRRKWYVQGSCATHGQGLFEGMDWLAGSIKPNKKRQSRL
mmetsp:Transcript_21574/g.52817  ORF Transcript_21574/g.52817 Transcript_21574/m.52817 type:complete len:187 (-) Transcript_21574:237-797(-)